MQLYLREYIYLERVLWPFMASPFRPSGFTIELASAVVQGIFSSTCDSRNVDHGWANNATLSADRKSIRCLAQALMPSLSFSNKNFVFFSRKKKLNRSPLFCSKVSQRKIPTKRRSDKCVHCEVKVELDKLKEFVTCKGCEELACHNQKCSEFIFGLDVWECARCKKNRWDFRFPINIKRRTRCITLRF